MFPGKGAQLCYWGNVLYALDILSTISLYAEIIHLWFFRPDRSREMDFTIPAVSSRQPGFRLPILGIILVGDDLAFAATGKAVQMPTQLGIDHYPQLPNS